MARPLDLSPGGALAIVEYNRAVFDRFVRRVRHLPWRAAIRRRGIGHESLFDTLVHILHVHEAWLVYIVPGRLDALRAVLRDPSSRSPTTWKAFDTYSASVWKGVEATVRGLTPRSLQRRVKAPWMPGVYTVRDAIYQTTLEEAHHLGEVIGALWQDDLASPNMTWIEVRRPTPARRRKR
ncbi:MAG: DinB family protein [Thermoplasmata archaeon]